MKAYKKPLRDQKQLIHRFDGNQGDLPIRLRLFFSMGLHVNSQVFRFFIYPEFQTQCLSSVHSLQKQTQMDCWQPIH